MLQGRNPENATKLPYPLMWPDLGYFKIETLLPPLCTRVGILDDECTLLVKHQGVVVRIASWAGGWGLGASRSGWVINI